MSRFILSNNLLLLRHAIYYSAGRVLTGIIGLISLSVLTHVLSPSDYGQYSVIVAVGLMIAGIGFQWLRQGLLRFKKKEIGVSSELLGTIGLLFFIVMFVVIAVAIIMRLISERFKFNFSSLEIMVICSISFSQAWFELAADAARTELKPWRYSLATFLRSILSLVFGVAAALLWNNIPLVILGVSLGYVIASFFAAPKWLMGFFNISSSTKNQAKSLLIYGIPLAGSFLMIFILDTVDRFMLASMQGYLEAGVYASSYNIAQFSIGTVLAGVGLGVLPIAVDSFRESDSAPTKKLLEYNLLIGIVICLPATVGLAMVSPVLNSLLLGNYVSGKSEIITAVIAFAIGLATLRSSCVDVIFMLYRRSWMQVLIIGFAALANILLNFFVIPRWGAVGAALSSLFAFAGAMVGSVWVSRSFMKISIGLIEVIKVVISTAAMAGVVHFTLRIDGGWLGLILSIIIGFSAYALLILFTNVAECRVWLLGKFKAFYIDRLR